MVIALVQNKQTIEYVIAKIEDKLGGHLEVGSVFLMIYPPLFLQ